MKIPTLGTTGLLNSKKGVLCLLILATATAAVLYSKIDGLSYSAIVATISTIFMWTTSKTEQAAINKAG